MTNFEKAFLNNVVKMNNGEFGEIDLYDTICEELNINDDSHDGEFEDLLEKHIDGPARLVNKVVNFKTSLKHEVIAFCAKDPELANVDIEYTVINTLYNIKEEKGLSLEDLNDLSQEKAEEIIVEYIEGFKE